ncbi:type II methionyl aminopeptidase [Candidatus Parvarchaeota archaeon]|nr:MAG: type II methionyl aminopeptidase [Candidatus Parvarchaeota archaeon]PXY71616.1 MAG: type II methionyl aminopeptidase [Candidatus Parvarchaeota archaeon]
MMKQEEFDKLKKAGEIAQKVIAYAKEIVKKEVPLLEIANKIDKKIEELGAKPAFPVNLSINEVAAHFTPNFNDQKVAKGLIKVDIGIQIDGYVADTAFSIDLDNSEENKKLIEAAKIGLDAALEKFGVGVEIGEIGTAVEEAIKEKGAIPIRNLTGHQIKKFDLHAGISIPSYSSGQTEKLEEGAYAVEPFSTNGAGRVRDGNPSNIYHLIKEGNVRDNFARKVLNFIKENYSSLPFCSRWIYNEFGSKGILALRQIEQAGLLHHYPQLVEMNRGIVAQAEHTIILKGNEKIITTKN